MGDDEALLSTVTSANVACGFHAGDPVTMLRTAQTALANGVAVGAHPAYRDLAGFGRRAMEIPHDELYGDVLYQIGALAGMLGSRGAGLAYVKPHGALYNRIAANPGQAAAVAAAVSDFRADLPVLGLPGSRIQAACADAGVPFSKRPSWTAAICRTARWCRVGSRARCCTTSNRSPSVPCGW